MMTIFSQSFLCNLYFMSSILYSPNHEKSESEV